MARVAINGLGRIGRSAFKILLENNDLELVAINDLVSPENLAYLLKYDSVYGGYEKEVNYTFDALIVDGKIIKVFNEKEPENLPWKELEIDLVFECTGLFIKKEDMMKHIKAGAKRVILSAASKSEDVETIVYGVNQHNQEDNQQVISCASCTTNCISPVIEILGRRIGIKKAIMTTVHAYTSSQSIVDSPNKKFRRGRAGAASFIPTTTGAAKATLKILPQYNERFDGIAIRGPVPTGSIADLVFITERKTSLKEINEIFEEESATDRYKQVLTVNKDEIVSSDIKKNPHASIVDLTMTRVVDGDLVKIMSWYDNEWGYANQLIREGIRLAKSVEHQYTAL